MVYYNMAKKKHRSKKTMKRSKKTMKRSKKTMKRSKKTMKRSKKMLKRSKKTMKRSKNIMKKNKIGGTKLNFKWNDPAVTSRHQDEMQRLAAEIAKKNEEISSLRQEMGLDPLPWHIPADVREREAEEEAAYRRDISNKEDIGEMAELQRQLREKAEKDDPDLKTEYPTAAAVSKKLMELHDLNQERLEADKQSRAGDSKLTDAEKELQEKLLKRDRQLSWEAF